MRLSPNTLYNISPLTTTLTLQIGGLPRLVIYLVFNVSGREEDGGGIHLV